MNKKLILSLTALSFSLTHAVEVFHFEGLEEGNFVAVCERSNIAKKNPRWYAKKEQNLFKNQNYHDPKNGKYLQLIEQHEQIIKRFQGKITTLKCRTYMTIKKQTP